MLENNSKNSGKTLTQTQTNTLRFFLSLFKFSLHKNMHFECLFFHEIDFSYLRLVLCHEICLKSLETLNYNPCGSDFTEDRDNYVYMTLLLLINKTTFQHLF